MDCDKEKMNLRDLDQDAIYAERIRSLQSEHAKAHAALRNWAAWSRDRHKVYPPGTTANPMWEQYRPNEGDDYGEEHAIPETRLAQDDIKVEAPEKEDYDEKSGYDLDTRIHGYGGLSPTVRLALRVAYVSRYLPEGQFHKAAGCSQDAFRERLLEALLFVSRFA